jgi:argininosuccinate lyase
MLETLSANAILMTTLSRLAEEFILWSSFEFRTLTLDDGFAMGSSMMPQKKNPGTLELLRGRSGRVNGLLVAGLTMMKGLPSGYNRDFHEEKEVLVESLELINRAAEIVPALVSSTQINFERMAELCFGNFATATELANHLVKRYKVPFRKAHHIVGSLVGELVRAKDNFANLPVCLNHLRKQDIDISEQELQQVLDPKKVMASYESFGGTGPKSVQAMMKDLKAAADEHQKTLSQDQKRVANAYHACRVIARDGKTAKTLSDFSGIIDKAMAQAA